MWNSSRRLAVPNRVETFDEEALARLHAIAVVPCLIRMIPEVEQLEAIALRQSCITLAAIFGRKKDWYHHKVLISSCPGVAERERILLELVVCSQTPSLRIAAHLEDRFDRPPDVDDRPSSLRCRWSVAHVIDKSLRTYLLQFLC